MSDCKHKDGWEEDWSDHTLHVYCKKCGESVTAEYVNELETKNGELKKFQDDLAKQLSKHPIIEPSFPDIFSHNDITDYIAKLRGWGIEGWVSSNYYREKLKEQSET